MFSALDRYFIQKQYRKAVLRFLGAFLQSQPPHLHMVLQTPLFGSLLKCLEHDTSTTVISQALTVLIMLLPHMPSSLVPHLPTLFNIYARLLFWSRERADTIESPAHEIDPTSLWETFEFEPDDENHSIPNLLDYFTILYGLYPLNFMDYIRKPQRYLRHANAANADDVEVQPTEIRHQSERFRRRHLLHPNFYTLTIESEKTDFSRWIKSEAPEVVAECTGLCLNPDSNQLSLRELQPIQYSNAPITTETSDKCGSESALLNQSVTLDAHPEDSGNTGSPRASSAAESRREPALTRQDSQSSRISNQDSVDTRGKEHGTDSPTLQPMLVQSPSHTQLQDMIQSNKAIKSGLNQSLANDSVPSLALSHQESVVDKLAGSAAPILASVASPPPVTEGTMQFQRQILLLQNDLNFEKYLKQQHMAYIGDLRRRQLEEARTEAETQNLVIMNRNLKSRFEEAKKAEMQVRKDSEKSRTIAKKWEADLANKVKNLRDESKKLKAEIEALRKEAEDRKLEIDKLRDLVCVAEVKELNLRQHMQSNEIHAAEIDKLKDEIERLTLAERDHQARELERQRAVNKALEEEEKTEVLAMQLAAREAEAERTKKIFQSQVATLQATLSEAQENPSRRVVAKQDVEAALAAGREKQAELQKQYNLLIRKYTALQSSLLDMKTEHNPKGLKIDTSIRPDSDADYLSMSGSPIMMKTRPHKGLSDQGGSEAAAYNVAQPSSSKPGTPTSAAFSHRTGSPPVMEGPRSESISVSPGQRTFGRSGSERLTTRSHSDLFSRRKESKEKQKEEDGEKKEKKSLGLRGIRGFI